MTTICTKCEHCIPWNNPKRLDLSDCAMTKKKTRDYVTGETVVKYRICSLVNKDGNCPDFKAGKPSVKEPTLIDMLAVVDPGRWDLECDIEMDDFVENELDAESFMVSDLDPDSKPVPADDDKRQEIIQEAWYDANNLTKWYYILKDAMPDEEATK